MALWSSKALAKATGGKATQDFKVGGLTIDSREISKGDLFIALTAARDGHDFVADALKKGAAGALVSHVPKGVKKDAPLIIVKDVMAALEDLGRAGRARTKAKVIGVTGSVGKTSTKEMLRTVLAGQGKVHAAERSFNNHWGVPLTLARMPKDADFAVIEIGMNAPGEIAPLAKMADLDVALITTVAPVHLFSFPNVEAIADEKASIIKGLRPKGVAVLNAGIPTYKILRKAAKKHQIITFGETKEADFRLRSAQPAKDMIVARASTNHGDILFKVMSLGRHFAVNALATLAVAEAVGLDPAIAACDIATWEPVEGRGQRERIVLDVVYDDLSFDLIDDAFNANPASVAAALDALSFMTPEHGIGRVTQGRRIAILGDMLELGTTAEALHAELAQHPAIASLEVVHCVGPLMRALYEALPLDKRGEWYETADELAHKVHNLIDAGDVVLVKGSKSIYVTRVVEALRKLGHAAPKES